MFLWRGWHVVVVLLMVFICGMALINPAWEHWYRVAFPPVFIAVAILAVVYRLVRK